MKNKYKILLSGKANFKVRTNDDFVNSFEETLQNATWMEYSKENGSNVHLLMINSCLKRNVLKEIFLALHTEFLKHFT